MHTNFNNAVDYYLDYFNNFITLEKFAEHHKMTLKKAESIINRGQVMHRKSELSKRKIEHIIKLRKIGLSIDYDDLRKIEKRASKLAEDCCNFLSMESTSFNRRFNRIVKDVENAFGGVLPDGFKLNLDPRGYALKIDYDKCEVKKDDKLITDFGGWGLLVPEFK